MVKPKVLVLGGYGINCERETAFAFDTAGANSELVHVNDLIDGHRQLDDYQILAFPGGFSYGDDTGAGNALATRLRNNLGDRVNDFVSSDKLVIGICNGFQVMANLGLLPGREGNYGDREVALVHNDQPRYIDRWVDLEFGGDSVWTRGLDRMSLPIAHGEGRFYAGDDTLNSIVSRGLVSAKYVSGEVCQHYGIEPNPNGSLRDIASISDESGRLIGMMPHPERAIDFTHLPNWTLLRENYRRSGREVPIEGPGIQIFKNGVEYFE
jgi:phosphoribosylformylglycinamidine synthase subunit PurQ / glutaminase